jgi:hypothetical protein
MKQLLYIIAALSLHITNVYAASTSSVSVNAQYAALAPEERAVFERRIVELAKTPSCHYGIPSIAGAIERFPAALFNNPNFRNMRLRPGRLDTLKRKACAKTLTLQPDTDIKLLNHVYALQQLQETGLLTKPFHTWELADLSRVNGWLSRLRTANPGKFRTHGLPLRIISGIPDATVRDIAKRLAHFTHTKEDERLLTATTYLLSEPEMIEPELSQWFKETQERLQRIQENKVSQIIHFELNVVGHMHYFLHKIHAWEKANTATACFLGNVIQMQHGVKPIIFTDKKEYKKMFYSNLTPEKARQEIFGNYIKSLILAQQKPKSSASSSSN